MCCCYRGDFLKWLCLAEMSSAESGGIVSRPNLNFEPTFDQELLSMRTRAFGPSHWTPMPLTSKGRNRYIRMGGKAVALGGPIVTVM